jgi:hypothetical protein
MTDGRDLEEASIAIRGALDEYRNIRPDTQNDRHLLLVTKWDAHTIDHVSKVEILEHPEEAEQIARLRYEQAISAFQALPLRPDQKQFNAYCAGMIAGDKLSMPKRGEPLRDAILSYPKHLWDWLYRTSLIQLGEHATSPFPEPPKPNIFIRFIDRFF